MISYIKIIGETFLIIFSSYTVINGLATFKRTLS